MVLGIAERKEKVYELAQTLNDVLLELAPVVHELPYKEGDENDIEIRFNKLYDLVDILADIYNLL